MERRLRETTPSRSPLQWQNSSFDLYPGDLYRSMPETKHYACTRCHARTSPLSPAGRCAAGYSAEEQQSRIIEEKRKQQFQILKEKQFKRDATQMALDKLQEVCVKHSIAMPADAHRYKQTIDRLTEELAALQQVPPVM